MLQEERSPGWLENRRKVLDALLQAQKRELSRRHDKLHKAQHNKYLLSASHGQKLRKTLSQCDKPGLAAGVCKEVAQQRQQDGSELLGRHVCPQVCYEWGILAEQVSRHAVLLGNQKLGAASGSCLCQPVPHRDSDRWSCDGRGRLMLITKSHAVHHEAMLC